MEHTKAEPLCIGSAKQLFVRDDLIESQENVARVINPPRKHPDNPVLTYEKPWEGNLLVDATLIHEQGVGFRMWYETQRRPGTGGSMEDDMVCYATSSDGVRWEKPGLGLVPYEGSKSNNITYFPDTGLAFVYNGMRRGGTHTPTLIKDEEEPDPARRFKMFYYSHLPRPGVIRVAFSPDGLHWSASDRVLFRAGDRNSAYYDRVRGQYMVCTRIPGRGQRTCGLWQSEDCERFEFVKEALHADEQDPPRTQLYGMVNFQYEGLWLGFLEMFYPFDGGRLNAQLIYSLDGLDWQRCADRRAFLDCGPTGDWDGTWAFPVNSAPVQVGDRLFIHYFGRNSGHGLPGDPPDRREPYGVIGAIGLALLRLDGFVSMDALFKEGRVTTRPLVFSGSELHINAVARPGYVSAELLDATGEVIAGCDRDSCLPMQMTDSVDHTLHWQGKGSLADLAGKPVQVRFFLRGARLYAFGFK